MISNRFSEGFARLQAAGSGIPDRIPFTTQMHEFAMNRVGVPPDRFYSEAEAFVSGLIETAEEFDFDIPSLGYDVYNIEAEAMGQPLHLTERQAPVIDKDAILIKEKGDLLRLKQPEAGVSGRMPFILEVHRVYRQHLGIDPAFQFCAPFSLATLVRGYVNFIQDIYADPEFAHDILIFLTEQVIAPWIAAQKRAFPKTNAAVGADALCSPPMVNPQIIEQFSIPYILRLRELCGLNVMVVNWWGDSHFEDVERFLELKLQVACGVIRAQDPDVARLGPRIFKEFARRHNLTLELGVGDVLLNQGPRRKIEDRIRYYISEAAEGGRFILYLAS
ncbi:MAG TPA: uroporphyrinogen decarboxylase family protein, partial [Spirochaetia bacterium]|nr:uroporphyrinogen decarboxylase family protein [Spirochaetia bacterium]